MAIKTAVITGASSGQGLALTKHLLAKTDAQWRIVMADINQSGYDSLASTLDSSRHTFVRTDVSSWADNVALFKRAYEFGEGRIDYFAANAGIGDKEAVLGPFDLDAEPEKPNLATIEVDLLGVFYGLKLFIYFCRRTRRELAGKGDTTPYNPKMIITASCVSQYPFHIGPQYAAAKHGCLGLTRSAAPGLLKHDKIALNCTMPGFVATGVIPAPVIAIWPQEHLTPMETILRAYDELMSETGAVVQDGKSQGKDGEIKSGCAVECSVDELFYREPVDYPNASQKFVGEQSLDDGIFGKFVAEMAASGKIPDFGPSTDKK